MSDGKRLARASLVMAIGTIVSRATGLVRMFLLVSIIGTALNGDIFELANSVPSSLYILVAGGIFNVVLVPQLVRTMKEDSDGGEAYANRVVTLGLLALAAATIVLLFIVPWIMRIVFSGELFTAGFEQQRSSAQLLMLLCMPQVFFYGAFVLVGQILNAREKFGPMMWAPIVNNIVAIAVLGSYALIFGVAKPPANDGFTRAEVFLLGGGSTLGIALQAAVLIPYLRQVGYRFRPRFDFRGVGLGHTFRLGAWTVAFIIVNQIAYFAIARLGASATIEGRSLGVPAAGQAVYALGYAITQVPHGIITVSVATAIIPTLAGLARDLRFDRFRFELSRTVRVVLLLVAPLATATAMLGVPLAGVIAGFGASRDSTTAIGTTIAAFSATVILFSMHYLVLRGFYALEDTRTPFFVQTVIASVNIGAAVVLTRLVEPIWVSTVLAIAYAIAYLFGLSLAIFLLSRRIGHVFDAEMRLFVAKILSVCVSAGLVMGLGLWLWSVYGLPSGSPLANLSQILVVGSAGAAVALLAIRLLRIEEFGYVLRSVKPGR